MVKVKQICIGVKRLPAGYQEVEYIKSSGTQRIDTGVRPDDTTYGFECKFNLISTSGDWNIMNLGANGISPEDGRYRYGFGGYTTQSWQIGYLMYSGSNSEACYATITNPAPASGIDYISIYNYNGNKSWSLNGSTYVDGTLKTGSYTYGINWNIFCQATGTSNYERFASMKLYYMKIYHGTELIRDFVPCYRKSDNVIGLYDLVNDVFYTNAGTGTFDKGSDINSSYYQVFPEKDKSSFRYLKFYISAVKDSSNNNTQMSEFEICDSSGTKMARPTGTTITASKPGNANEGIEKIIDGSTSTKYCTNNIPPITITIDFGEKIDFSIYNKYKRYTANDYAQRDPNSWTVSLSNDGENWTKVSDISNANVTSTRYALAGTWDINLPS